MLSANYKQGEHVTLPNAVYWPTLNSSVLFVRYFYDAFFEHVLHNLEPDIVNKNWVASIIIGNPGIGKSAFAMYALFRALRDHRTVVYLARKSISGYLFKDGEVFTFSKQQLPCDLSTILDDPSTVLIVDGMEPPTVRAVTLLVTSPRKDVWHDFYKTGGCARYYFPVFSLDEIQHCRRICFPEIDESGVLERFERWGGIPRYVLAKLDRDAQTQLESAARSVTLDQLLAHAEALEISDRQDLSHRLLHIKLAGEVDTSIPIYSPDFYTNVRSELASNYVSGLVYAAAAASKRSQLIALISSEEKSRAFSVMRGHLFEQEALKVLEVGGRFLVRQLSPTGAVKSKFKKFAPSDKMMFGTIEELTGNLRDYPRALHVPRSKSQCAIDAILPGGLPANATLNVNHGIRLEGKKRAGLAGVLAAMGCGEGDTKPAPFYWLVPPDVFDALRRPMPYKDKANETVKEPALDPLAARVVQYALRIPLLEDRRGAVKTRREAGVASVVSPRKGAGNARYHTVSTALEAGGRALLRVIRRRV